MKRTLFALATLAVFSSANADVIYEPDAKSAVQSKKQQGTFHSGIGTCPQKIVEDERTFDGATQFRVTVVERQKDGSIVTLNYTPSKTVSDGLSNPVVWHNNGLAKKLSITFPVLDNKTQSMENHPYDVCSFGEAYLTAKIGKDGKNQINIRVSDKTVAGIIPVSDAKTGAFAELPIYSKESVNKSATLANGEKFVISWHSPETGLVRHMTLERLR